MKIEFIDLFAHLAELEAQKYQRQVLHTGITSHRITETVHADAFAATLSLFTSYYLQLKCFKE